jgi:hypothetical protein
MDELNFSEESSKPRLCSTKHTQFRVALNETDYILGMASVELHSSDTSKVIEKLIPIFGQAGAADISVRASFTEPLKAWYEEIDVPEETSDTPAYTKFLNLLKEVSKAIVSEAIIVPKEITKVKGMCPYRAGCTNSKCTFKHSPHMKTFKEFRKFRNLMQGMYDKYKKPADSEGYSKAVSKSGYATPVQFKNTGVPVAELGVMLRERLQDFEDSRPDTRGRTASNHSASRRSASSTRAQGNFHDDRTSRWGR